jgi:heat shock protein beta
VSRILDIVVNSLYQNKDVFLRELISNASDALDKVRFIGITKPEVYEDKQELEVRISFNPDDVSLTITDSGIGMTKDELIGNLGTIAQSGTTNFLDALKDGASVDQIGMFGVGFYSAFLVAEKIVVASKSPNQDTQHVWISHNGQSSFSVAEDPRGNTLGRGTEITLYLKEDAFE